MKVFVADPTIILQPEAGKSGKEQVMKEVFVADLTIILQPEAGKCGKEQVMKVSVADPTIILQPAAEKSRYGADWDLPHPPGAK